MFSSILESIVSVSLNSVLSFPISPSRAEIKSTKAPFLASISSIEVSAVTSLTLVSEDCEVKVLSVLILFSISRLLKSLSIRSCESSLSKARSFSSSSVLLPSKALTSLYFASISSFASVSLVESDCFSSVRRAIVSSLWAISLFKTVITPFDLTISSLTSEILRRSPSISEVSFAKSEVFCSVLRSKSSSICSISLYCP